MSPCTSGGCSRLAIGGDGRGFCAVGSIFGPWCVGEKRGENKCLDAAMAMPVLVTRFPLSPFLFVSAKNPAASQTTACMPITRPVHMPEPWSPLHDSMQSPTRVPFNGRHASLGNPAPWDRDQSVISVSICSAYQLHSFLFGAEKNFPGSTPHGKPLLMGVD